MKDNYLPSLNGLRALCIIAVIGNHLVEHGYIDKTPFEKAVGWLLFNGPLGVQVFFVISGFLVTRLMIAEERRDGSTSLVNFYIRRTLRIFPAYFFLLTVYFVLQTIGYFHLSTTNWFSNLTYTKQFFQDRTVETAHLWSLSVEEMFYLVWPVLYIRFFKKLRLRYLYLLVFSFAVIRYFNFGIPATYGNTIISTGDALLMGCIAAMNYNKISGFIKMHPKLPLLAFPFLAGSVFVLSYMFHLSGSPNLAPPVRVFTEAAMPFLYAFAGNVGLFTNMAIAVIIIYSINVEGFWFKVLNNKVLNYLGMLSYSIYLWQQLFVSERMHAFNLDVPGIVILILFCAHISYYIIERPFLLLKDRFKVVGFGRKVPLHA